MFWMMLYRSDKDIVSRYGETHQCPHRPCSPRNRPAISCIAFPPIGILED